MAPGTATSTVTVNAAFLQEIKEVNEELWQLHGEVLKMCLDPATIHAHPRRFVEQLETLRDHVALHFALEEAYGYFEDPVEVAPRLCTLAFTLRAEHRQLYVQVCEVVDRAVGILDAQRDSSLVLEAAAAFVAFNDQFKRHESREVELIQQEYADDIGVGD